MIWKMIFWEENFHVHLNIFLDHKNEFKFKIKWKSWFKTYLAKYFTKKFIKDAILKSSGSL